MSAGGTFAQLLRAGQWRGNAVRAHLDLGEAARRVMVDILIEDPDDEPSELSLSPQPYLSAESRGVTPLVTSAQMGGLRGS